MTAEPDAGNVEAEVIDMLALRFPSWQQYERDEFAHRINGLLDAVRRKAGDERAEQIAQAALTEPRPPGAHWRTWFARIARESR